VYARSVQFPDAHAGMLVWPADGFRKRQQQIETSNTFRLLKIPDIPLKPLG